MSSPNNNCNPRQSNELLVNDVNSKVLEKTNHNEIFNNNHIGELNSNEIESDSRDDGGNTNINIDAHASLEILQLVCDEYKIAEALAKTTALTSTIQLKQRLLARKLELERSNKDTNCRRSSIDFDIEGYEPPRDILLYLVR